MRRTVIGIVLLCVLQPVSAYAVITALIASPVDHPIVSRPGISRTSYIWRNSVGAWGESFAEEHLKLRGYKDVREIKLHGGQGIDRVAFRRDSLGRVTGMKIVEVKTTTQAGADAKLGKTKIGRQLSERWTANHVTAMRRSSDPGTRSLAKEILVFRKSSGVSLRNMSEVYHINVAEDRFRRLDYKARFVLSEERLGRTLTNISKRAESVLVRRWAVRNLTKYADIRADALRATTGYLPVQAASLSASRLAMAKVLGRAAGPAAAISIGGWEVGKNIYLYSRGDVTRRQFYTSTSQGLAGGGAALAGGYIGGQLGTLGGPFAWLTIPAGAILGAGVGYWAGSSAAGYASNAWFDSLDETLKEKVMVEILKSGFSQVIVL